MRTKSYQFTGVALNRPGSWVSTSCNKASASARTWRRQLLIARGSPCASTNGDLSRSDTSIRAAAFAAQRSKALACCRHASRTMRLTSARSTDRRAFRLPTVTPKRTFAELSQIAPAAVQAALIDNICRAARIDCSRAARRTAEYWAGVLSRRAEAKPLWLSRAATLNSTAALTRCLQTLISIAGASNSQALPALGAARSDHGATSARLHAHQKTMRASALDLGGLISSFGGHHTLSSCSPPLDAIRRIAVKPAPRRC